jgi:endo-1,4-beta-xylanase
MKRKLRTIGYAITAATLIGACAENPADETAHAELAVSSVTSGSVTATLSTTSDWGAGFCDNVTISNKGSNVTNWTIKIATNGATLSQIWNAKQTTSGTTMTVTPADFNKTISSNGSVNFGYCGAGTQRPTLTSITVDGGNGGTGGTPSTGGTKATGGTPSTGGTKATGGTPSTGGTKATGGTPSTGGSSSTVKKFCGNITTGNSVDTNGMKYSKYWDQITPENAGKWGSVQSTPSSAFNWSSLDAIYNYTQTNNISFKQHTFVWGAQQPSGTPTLAQVENWIKSFCARYPNTKLIDVVNEPPPHTTPSYTANLGAGESGSYPWITKAFKLARKYCGNAVLILNDYNNIEYADQEQHFIDIVNDIKKNGAPIDAVGAQAHAIYSFSAATAQTNINKMASGTGLPVYITEYDVPKASDADQLAVFQAQFPVFWNTAAVRGVTVWGWINGKTWVNNTGLVNGTTPRSSMTWLMNYLKRPIPPN